MKTASKTNGLVVTFADLVGSNTDAPVSLSQRTTNFLAVKTAKVGAAISAATDGFGTEFDKERAKCKAINGMYSVKRDQDRVDELNAVANRLGLNMKFQ